MVVLDIDHKNLMFNGYRGSRGVDELTKLVSWVNVECSLDSLLDGLGYYVMTFQPISNKLKWSLLLKWVWWGLDFVIKHCI